MQVVVDNNIIYNTSHIWQRNIIVSILHNYMLDANNVGIDIFHKTSYILDTT